MFDNESNEFFPWLNKEKMNVQKDSNLFLLDIYIFWWKVFLFLMYKYFDKHVMKNRSYTRYYWRIYW